MKTMDLIQRSRSQSIMPILKWLMLLMVLWPRIGWADGMAFDIDTAQYQPLVEREQVAAIAFNQGREKMTLAVNLDRHPNHRSLWIFPVPGTPKTTKLNLVASFPMFSGVDPKRQASSKLESSMALVRGSQLYPFLLEGGVFMGAAHMETASTGAVFQETDKFGLHSELIYAASLKDLEAVLKRQHVSLSAAQGSALAPYLNGKYTIVGTWLNPPHPAHSVPPKPEPPLVPNPPVMPPGVQISFDAPVSASMPKEMPLNQYEVNRGFQLEQAKRRAIRMPLDATWLKNPVGIQMVVIPGKPTELQEVGVDFPDWAGRHPYIPGGILYSPVDRVPTPAELPLPPGVIGRRDDLGLHTDLIRAASLGEIIPLLGSNYAKMPTGQRAALQNAIWHHHAVVICWATDPGLLHATLTPPPPLFPPIAPIPPAVVLPSLDETPCVSVEFATPQAFFPLKPTNVYGSALVPARLYIVGYVRLETMAPLKSVMRVSHYRSRWNDRKSGPSGAEAFGNIPRGQAWDYTLIEIESAASNYTDDLRFVPDGSWRMQFAEGLSASLSVPYDLPFVFLTNALLSYLCAGLAGLILVRRWKGFAVLGFWNLLSLIGVIVASNHFATRNVKYQRNGQPVTVRFCFLFSVLFFLSSIMLQIGLTLLI
jgi:hypothetical protein